MFETTALPSLRPQLLQGYHEQKGAHGEGALGEQGAHVALAAEARQAQALCGVLHYGLHRPEQRRLWPALRGLDVKVHPSLIA